MQSVDSTFISIIYLQIKSLYSKHIGSNAASSLSAVCRAIYFVWRHTIISILTSFTYPRICKLTRVWTKNKGYIHNIQTENLFILPIRHDQLTLIYQKCYTSLYYRWVIFIKISHMASWCENSLSHFNRANTNHPPNCMWDISIAMLYIDVRGFSMYGKCVLHM